MLVARQTIRHACTRVFGEAMITRDPLTYGIAIRDSKDGANAGPPHHQDRIPARVAKPLGFSRRDRNINVRRIGWVCELLGWRGIYTCAAAMSP
jgi:hypothetical protein